MEDILNLLNTNNRFLIAFLVLAVCDMCTGVIGAIIKKELKSSKFREGLLKKALELILILIGFIGDWCFGLEMVGKGVTISIIAMECWSIVENIEPYVPIPEILKNFLESVKANGNQNV